MKKQDWKAPSLEVLSTRRTAAGGSDVVDGFHTGGSDLTNTNPSRGTPPVS